MRKKNPCLKVLIWRTKILWCFSSSDEIPQTFLSCDLHFAQLVESIHSRGSIDFDSVFHRPHRISPALIHRHCPYHLLLFLLFRILLLSSLLWLFLLLLLLLRHFSVSKFLYVSISVWANSRNSNIYQLLKHYINIRY